ncbi:MAG: NAD-dependent epimerase [Frankiales bacterium]|nr:NAD-dependent epimerase [Frankiales bacterium]
MSRSAPQERVEGVQYEVGPAEQKAAQVVPGADAVVATLSPRGDMAGRLVAVYTALSRLSAQAGARYLQIGGFSSLRPAPGAPRFAEGEVPEEYRQEALEGEASRVMLVEDAPAELDWASSARRAATAPSRPGSAPAPTAWATRSRCSTRTARPPCPPRTSRSPSSTRSSGPRTTGSTSGSRTSREAGSHDDDGPAHARKRQACG